MNSLFCTALKIRAKNGIDNKYLPTINRKMIAKTEPKIVEIRKKLENVSDLALAINHKKPYTIEKITIPKNIKFIINDHNN